LEIENAFKKLEELIEEIEFEEELHGSFKYAYDNKFSCYLSSMGKKKRRR